MKNKNLVIIAIAMSLTSCAGTKLKSEWKDQRGYSDSDIQEIMVQHKDYNWQMAAATTFSNRFNTAPIMETRSRFKSIFCACVKKLGDKCRQKPEGLADSDKTLWIKANAIDLAMMGNATTFETSSMSTIDPAECN